MRGESGNGGCRIGEWYIVAVRICLDSRTNAGCEGDFAGFRIERADMIGSA